MTSLVIVLVLVGIGTFLAVLWLLRQRGMDRWIIPYAAQAAKRWGRSSGQQIHAIICIADHYEPKWNGASRELARERVERWVEDYPDRFGGLHDCDGRPPQHTFFYPIDEYEAEHVDALATLCRAGFGELEVHLHHDHDTAENLRETLLRFKELLTFRHGLLARQKRSGILVYGFIHGNWALDNSHPEGRCCGVDNELTILRETGCYADFTLPSAPDPTQTRKINSIYYAVGAERCRKAHDSGVDVGRGPAPANGLMLIQGPLLLDWRNRKWGLLPRIENGCVQANQPPSQDRLDLWLKARIQVAARPDWFFVKMHTHGAVEQNRQVLLGDPMVQFHQGLARRAKQDAKFCYHYVTARELYNLVRAAEAGWQGSVADARNFELEWNGCRTVGPTMEVSVS
jgi:hypothetical protein